MSAFRQPNGHRAVEVFAQDNTATVTGSMGDEFTGGLKLFWFRSDLSSAHIGSLGPLLTGWLTYRATSSCGSDYTNGIVKGRLVVHDPVLGTLRFVGRRATKMFGGPRLNSGGSGCTSV